MCSNGKGSVRGVVATVLVVGITATAGAQPVRPVGDTTAEQAAGISSTATDGVALDMQTGVDRAVNWHPLMRHAQGQLLQTGEGIEAARAGYYPRISAGVNTRTGNQNLTGYDSRHAHRAEITVQQTLYDFGKVGSEVGRAQASSDVARASVLLSLDEVVRNTAQAWIEIRRQQALVKVAQEQVEAVEDLAQLAQTREAEGASTYSDTIQARARVEAAQVSLLTAQSQVMRWRTTLMNWVGGRSLPQVAGEPVAGLDRVCAQTASVNPQEAAALVSAASAVQVAEAQLTVARAGVDVAKSQERPTLSVDASAGRGLNSGSRRPGESAADATVMLNFSMPLYQGGRLKADRRAAEYAVQTARAALEQTRLNADQGLQDAALSWRENVSRIKIQATREESMRITRTLYREQYLQLGTRSLLDLLNAEQEYHAARSDQIDSEHNMYRSGVDCLYYTGQSRVVFGLDEAAARSLGATNGLEGR
ncbi:MAG: TolC family outer membrane protein [Burkholderiaceae bacterium]|nr:TolC family outer membrane protein [Burkholderiaceae bacterium]